MRKGSKANLVRDLRELSERLKSLASRVDLADDEPFRWSVTWGPSGILLADRNVTREEAEDIAAGAIWALFESSRNSQDPADPLAFERVMTRVAEFAARRCWQIPGTTQDHPTEKK